MPCDGSYCKLVVYEVALRVAVQEQIGLRLEACVCCSSAKEVPQKKKELGKKRGEKKVLSWLTMVQHHIYLYQDIPVLYSSTAVQAYDGCTRPSYKLGGRCDQHTADSTLHKRHRRQYRHRTYIIFFVSTTCRDLLTNLYLRVQVSHN